MEIMSLRARGGLEDWSLLQGNTNPTQRANSLEKTTMLGKTEGKRRGGRG